jgi:predicted transposase YbfD/YdcC
LRFIVIQDRYDEKYNRTIEELKHRYYSIAKRLLEQRKDYDHPIIKSGYNYEQEMKRRACLERMISKTKEDNNQEYSILKQSLEIEKRIEKLEKFENELKNITDETKFDMTFEEYVKSNANENDSFVYLRSNKIKYNLPVGEKIQKKVESLLKELLIPEKLIPTNAVEQAYDNLRNNLIILTSLKKHLDKKEREFIKLNHYNNELQNKYIPPRNFVAAIQQGNNINNLNNIGAGIQNANSNTNLNSAAVIGNINNPSNNLTLSLHESNDLSVNTTNLTNKDKMKKNAVGASNSIGVSTPSGFIPQINQGSSNNINLNNAGVAGVINANKFIRKVIIHNYLKLLSSNFFY